MSLSRVNFWVLELLFVIGMIRLRLLMCIGEPLNFLSRITTVGCSNRICFGNLSALTVRPLS